VREVATNVGQALQTAMRGIEQSNPPTLDGIFGDSQWTNKDRLSDALLKNLIEHFSQPSLGNSAAKADVLGQSYEYVIKKFADATNKKAGGFSIPRSVVRLMVNILDPCERESLYAPAGGTGGMFIESIQHVKETPDDDRTLWGKLSGQEKKLTTSAIARMNLFLHGAADFQIVRGDTLRSPAFLLFSLLINLVLCPENRGRYPAVLKLPVTEHRKRRVHVASDVSLRRKTSFLVTAHGGKSCRRKWTAQPAVRKGRLLTQSRTGDCADHFGYRAQERRGCRRKGTA